MNVRYKEAGGSEAKWQPVLPAIVLQPPGPGPRSRRGRYAVLPGPSQGRCRVQPRLLLVRWGLGLICNFSGTGGGNGELARRKLNELVEGVENTRSLMQENAGSQTKSEPACVLCAAEKGAQHGGSLGLAQKTKCNPITLAAYGLLSSCSASKLY